MPGCIMDRRLSRWWLQPRRGLPARQTKSRSTTPRSPTRPMDGPHHFNYAFSGVNYPPFPGGLVPNHALNATPEFAYGLTKWLDSDSTFHGPSTSKASFCPTPSSSERCSWFPTPPSEISSTGSIRIRLHDPAVFPDPLRHGNSAQHRLAQPELRVHHRSNFQRRLRPTWRRGLCAGSAACAHHQRGSRLRLGVLCGLQRLAGRVSIFSISSSTISYAVTDFKVGVIDVDFGLGYGLTPGSNQFMAKTIISYAIPVKMGRKPIRCP